jgi:hypothetical protein
MDPTYFFQPSLPEDETRLPSEFDVPDNYMTQCPSLVGNEEINHMAVEPKTEPTQTNTEPVQEEEVPTEVKEGNTESGYVAPRSGYLSLPH